jgi:putative ABC transport system permease protein
MPDWTAAVRARLSQLNLTGARESEIVEELSAHLDQRFGELLAAGQSAGEAERLALEELDAQMQHSLWERRAYSWLFAAFAAVAILLAAAGIYGVISFGVSRRTREIGIRMALGAHPSQVMRTVLAGGMTLVGIGAAAGLIASQFSARLLQSLLFGVSAHDVGAYAAVVVGIAAVGFLANYIPARRASRVDPTTALRFE